MTKTDHVRQLGYEVMRRVSKSLITLPLYASKGRLTCSNCGLNLVLFRLLFNPLTPVSKESLGVSIHSSNMQGRGPY